MILGKVIYDLKLQTKLKEIDEATIQKAFSSALSIALKNLSDDSISSSSLDDQENTLEATASKAPQPHE